MMQAESPDRKASIEQVVDQRGDLFLPGFGFLGIDADRVSHDREDVSRLGAFRQAASFDVHGRSVRVFTDGETPFKTVDAGFHGR